MTGFVKIRRSMHRRVVRATTQYAGAKDCAVSFDEWMALTRHPDPKIRARAVSNACPCQLKRNVPELWNRLIEMVMDDDSKVRSYVFHTLGDGSPRAREAEVVAAMERMWNDPDEKLRKRVRKVLSAYRWTENINVL